MSSTLASLGLPEPEPAKRDTLAALGLPEPVRPSGGRSRGKGGGASWPDPYSPEEIARRDEPLGDEGLGPLSWLPLARAGTAGYKGGEILAGPVKNWILNRAARGAASGAAAGGVEAASREANPVPYVASGAAGGAVLGPAVEAAIPAVGGMLRGLRGKATAPGKPSISPVEPTSAPPVAKEPVAPGPASTGVPVAKAPIHDPAVSTRRDPYPVAANVVDGRLVRSEIPNRGSIESSLEDYRELPGVRDVPMAEFSTTGTHYSVQGTKRIAELAGEIAESKELNPLIVVLDQDPAGPYILEGATRIEALHQLKAKSFPAKIVVDVGSLERAVKARKPVSAMAVDAVNGKLPEGYRLEGKAYVYEPPTPAVTAPVATALAPKVAPPAGPVTGANAQQFPALGEFVEQVKADPAYLARVKELGGGRVVSNKETLARAAEAGPMDPSELAAWPADAPIDPVTQTRGLLTFDYFQQARTRAIASGDLTAAAAAQKTIAGLMPGVENLRATGGRVTQAQAMFVQDEMSKILDSLADMQAKGVPFEQVQAKANEMLRQAEASAKVAGKSSEIREALRGLETAATWVKLTSPVTHGINFTSNAAVFAGVRPFEQVGRAATYLGQGNRIAAESELQALFGTRMGFISGMKRWAAAVMDDAEQGALSSEYGQRGGKWPRALRPFDVFRQLSGADAFWKGILEDARIYQLAYRSAREAGLTGKALGARIEQLRLAPPEAWAAEAKAYGKEYTFQMDPDAFLKMVQGIGNLPGAKFILPFTKTPYNLQKFFMQRSVYGLASRRNIGDLAAGGQAQAEAVGRLSAGIALSAGALALVNSTEATGPYPSNPRERERWKANGTQEYSIRLPNGTWLKYSRFSPIGSYIGQAVALRDAMARGEQNRIEVLASGMLASAMRQTFDLPFMTGISDLMDAFKGAGEPEGQDKGAPERLAQGIVTGLVPNIARDVRQQTDPTMREARGVPQAVQNMLPGQSQKLPASIDVLGRERTYEPDRVLRATKVLTTQRTSPETDLFARLEWSPNAPSLTLEKGKEKKKLEGEQAAQFKREMGAATEKAVREVIAAHPNLDKMEREDAVELIQKKVEAARKPVRKRWTDRTVVLKGRL